MIQYIQTKGDTSRMRKKEIEKRIQKIKNELMKTEEMRPGSLSKQSKGSKKEYYQLSYTHANRGRTEYIRPGFVKKIQKEIKNYGNFKKLTNEWVKLAIEHSKLNMELEKKAGQK